MGELIAGHFLREPADWDALAEPPAKIGYRVSEWADEKLWVIETFRFGPAPEWPMTRFADDEDSPSVRVRQLAPAFATASDILKEHDATGGSALTILNLGAEMAALLGRRVFSVAMDDDTLSLCAVCAPDQIERIRHRRDFHELLLANGSLRIGYDKAGVEEDDEEVPDLVISAHARLATLPNVTMSDRWTSPRSGLHAVFPKELRDFLARPDPGYELGAPVPDDLTTICERVEYPAGHSAPAKLKKAKLEYDPELITRVRKLRAEWIPEGYAIVQGLINRGNFDAVIRNMWSDSGNVLELGMIAIRLDKDFPEAEKCFAWGAAFAQQAVQAISLGARGEPFFLERSLVVCFLAGRPDLARSIASATSPEQTRPKPNDVERFARAFCAFVRNDDEDFKRQVEGFGLTKKSRYATLYCEPYLRLMEASVRNDAEVFSAGLAQQLERFPLRKKDRQLDNLIDGDRDGNAVVFDYRAVGVVLAAVHRGMVLPEIYSPYYPLDYLRQYVLKNQA